MQLLGKIHRLDGTGLEDCGIDMTDLAEICAENEFDHQAVKDNDDCRGDKIGRGIAEIGHWLTGNPFKSTEGNQDSALKWEDGTAQAGTEENAHD